ncbi:ATP-dependent helicase fft2 [Thoreauomyces humboldtii]|nr:ATP-dependent helicase fft2 [Thoreauomyces humboldtii]
MDAGKVETLKPMILAMRERGDRILLFSQFVMMLDILEAVMDTMGVKYLRMDGQTNVGDRQTIIDQYNEDPDVTVFLLSTKAGGFGINLTSANVVIIYDMDFNPHNDAQAEDRAHRVGQTRDVTVWKLVLDRSIEQHILRRAQTKLKLDERVQGTQVVEEGAEDQDKGKNKGKGKGKKKGEDDNGGGGGGGGDGTGESDVEVDDTNFLDMLRDELVAGSNTAPTTTVEDGDGVGDAASVAMTLS